MTKTNWVIFGTPCIIVPVSHRKIRAHLRGALTGKISGLKIMSLNATFEGLINDKSSSITTKIYQPSVDISCGRTFV